MGDRIIPIIPIIPIIRITPFIPITRITRTIRTAPTGPSVPIGAAEARDLHRSPVAWSRAAKRSRNPGESRAPNLGATPRASRPSHATPSCAVASRNSRL